MGNKNEEYLRDSRCNGVMVERELVDKADFTGEKGDMLTVDQIIKRAPTAMIEVDTPFYIGTVRCNVHGEPPVLLNHWERTVNQEAK